jgi:hypothetical protein
MLQKIFVDQMDAPDLVLPPTVSGRGDIQFIPCALDSTFLWGHNMLKSAEAWMAIFLRSASAMQPVPHSRLPHIWS